MTCFQVASNSHWKVTAWPAGGRKRVQIHGVEKTPKIPSVRFSGTSTDWPFKLAAGEAKSATIVVEKDVVITGRVLSPDGQPVAGATAARALTGTANSLTGDTRFSVPTKEDGTFEMHLPASHKTQYNLVAHDGEYNQWRNWANGVLPPIQTVPGQKIENVEIRLTRGGSVKGRVLDSAGRVCPRRSGPGTSQRSTRKSLLRPDHHHKR